MDLKKLEHAVKDILEAVGDESAICPETPPRVARGLAEILDGYDVDIDSLFVVEGGEGRDQVVLIKDIEYTSLCRHHLLPFRGKAHVAYLPTDRVIGVSKIARLVLAFAHRLQLQEKLTREVAYTLMDKLKPHGVAVIMASAHSCMQCRGVKSFHSEVITSEMLGDFRSNSYLRQELLALLGVSCN